jgi:hypothetical protein
MHHRSLCRQHAHVHTLLGNAVFLLTEAMCLPITAVLPAIMPGMALPATALMLLVTTIVCFGLTIPIRNRYKRRHFQHGDPFGEPPIWRDPVTGEESAPISPFFSHHHEDHPVSPSTIN